MKRRIVKVKRAAHRIARTPFDPVRPTDGMEAFHVRDAAGRALARDELPVARALRGETVPTAIFRLSGGHPPQDIRVRASVRPLRDVGGRVRGAMLIFDELSV